MNNYNALVSVARDSARDSVLLKLTNDVRNEILAISIASGKVDSDIAAINKEIAVLTYKLSKVDTLDPEATEKTNRYNDLIKEANEDIAELNKEKDCYTTKTAKLNEEIAAIQSGSKKVSVETLARISTDYLEKMNVAAMLADATAVVSAK